MQEQRIDMTNAIMVDDRQLYGLQEVKFEDYPQEQLTRIILDLLVVDNQSIVDLMRKKRFTLRVFSGARSGWIASDCELEKFNMWFSLERNYWQQKIVLTTKLATFTYMSDISAEALLEQEKQDIANLIAIIKQNKEKSVGQVEVVIAEPEKNIEELKDDDIVWANAVDPVAVEDFIKPRKLKKVKKTK